MKAKTLGDIKILVVDDEPSVCEGIGDILEKEGYTVKSATSGEDALDIVRKHGCDIVLMDLIMPGMDGADTCEEIKKMRPDAKVVAISGSPSSERLEKFLRSGGIELYLYKPFGKEELLKALDRAISGEYIKFREDA